MPDPVCRLLVACLPLSRTSWRGVSFALAPGAKTFAKAFLVGYSLTLLTLGLYAPIWMNRMHAITLQRTSFGNLPFRYEGKDSEVWKMSIKGFLLSIVTLGVYYFWFLAALGRYRMEHTRHMSCARTHPGSAGIAPGLVAIALGGQYLFV